MKTGTQIDAKRRAAGEREEENGGTNLTVGLINEDEIPTVVRAGKRSALLETQEWKAACELLNKGLPAGKVLRIPLSAETLKLAKSPTHTRIAFKRHLVNHAKRMKWAFDFSLKGDTIFASSSKKSK